MSRSRITIGVLTGVAVVAVAAMPSLASSNEPAAAPASTATAPPATAGRVATAAVTTGTSSTAGRVAAAAVATKAVTAKATTPKALATTTVRSVKLIIPVTTNKVGTNVTGLIQVLDTTNKVSVPVAGVEVGLEEKRGTKYIEIASGLTDENGTFAIAFTSDTNASFRAVLKPATGKPVYGALVKTSAVAQVTWASRPTMTAVKKTKVTYSFRVNPEQGTAQLQIANTKTPKTWIKSTAVKVPNNGVVTTYVIFPAAGTWFVRGASVANTSNVAGYTSSITATVR